MFRLTNLYSNIGNKSILKFVSLKLTFSFLFLILINLLLSNQSIAQSSSMSAWHFLDGNPEATRLNKAKSSPQGLDTFKIKWAVDAISGDVQPLIGNIVNNSKINKNFIFNPNEIAAVVSGRIVIIDATGNVHKYNDYIPYIKDLSVLIDTLSTNPYDKMPNPVVLGIESIEMKSPDGLSHAYLAGFDPIADTAKLIRRLTLDLREYAPNSYANIKPILGRKFPASNDYSIFSVVNCASPEYTSFNSTLPYFRGITEFITPNNTPNYPLPDIKDVKTNRYHLPGDVGFASPSITYFRGMTLVAMPYYAYHSTLYDTVSINDNKYQNVISGKYPYLAIYDISSSVTKPLFEPLNIQFLINGSKPQIRPYFVKTNDRATGDSLFLIIAEEYLGRDSSFGTPTLHLFNVNGDSLTRVNDFVRPPFSSAIKNHQWTIAVGNVDGNSTNNWQEFFPNNPGNEILVTESSKKFAVAESKLSVLKYYSGPRQIKPSPPDAILFPFDTICTKRVNGWIAAVNDIDGASDGKDEIFLVDGSTLRVLRMVDYTSFKFKSWNPFDTVYTMNFKNQIISSVSVADVEGDGLNDIIVTTQDSTYLIGVEIPNEIKVLSPKKNAGVFCVGDSITIEWHNVVKTSNRIDILFRPTKNNLPIDSIITIHQNYNNTTDTTRYNYRFSSILAGKEGYFIVQESDNPSTVNDITGIVTVQMPSINLNITNPQNLIVGSKLYLDGDFGCVDSIKVQYSVDAINWFYSDSVIIDTNGTFATEFLVPCPDNMSCTDSVYNNNVLIRCIYSKFDYIDTVSLAPSLVKPMVFPIVIEPCSTACPTMNFSWDLSALNITDSLIYVLLSTDGGITFSEIDNFNSNIDNFKWEVPNGITPNFILRFCTENACIRTDTLLKHQVAQYINSISPNPYNPMNGLLDIVYEMSNDADVTIKILDPANRIVAEPVRNIHRIANTIYCDFWDGKRSDGSYCDNGVYYILLELSTGDKQVYPVFIKK